MVHVDFTSEQTARQLLRLLHNEFAAKPSKVNKYISDLTRKQSGIEGAYRFTSANGTWIEKYLEITKDFGLMFEFGVKDGFIQGINSFSFLRLLEALSPFVLDSEIEMAETPGECFL